MAAIRIVLDGEPRFEFEGKVTQADIIEARRALDRLSLAAVVAGEYGERDIWGLYGLFKRREEDLSLVMDMEHLSYEAARPVVCECGQRCRSERGLAMHQAKSPRHKEG